MSACPIETAPLECPRVAFLMNVIAPYHKPVLDCLARRYRYFRIVLSTPMEKNRSWDLAWSGLDVVVGKTVTLDRTWRHPGGFSEPLFVHLPLDTWRQLGRFRPHVVVSWEMGLRTILAMTFRHSRRKTRLLVWAEFAESTEYGRGRMRQLIRRVLHRFIDGFLVTGSSGARYLQQLGVPERKLHRIVYTTEVSRFAASPMIRKNDEAHRLLYVGQLIERKGLLPFLEVLAQWANAHPDRIVEFEIAGSGPLREQITAASMPPNCRVTLLGEITYDRLPEVYARAGIFVFPTLADTWGVVVNEALAAGLPVLGSLHGQAVSELVEDGANGWTFSPGRSESMLTALDRCLNASDAALARMRMQARSTALSLTPDYVAGLVEQAVQKVSRPVHA